ncbi:MAG: redox-sensitive bicupin YhaK (pirin superfamily) [Moritella sp.]|jgi:redox-sensitive bicupin YhaK (pirin superfamily)
MGALPISKELKMTDVIKKNTTSAVSTKELVMTTTGMAASDGDGVKLTRIIGSPQLDMLDPFLLLDCFESDQAEDYIGGFPTHPHRGFETVTYLLNGRMRHKDSKGNEGVIEPGGVQWMTAGKGILHSEMPEQQDGLLKGFQLWVNLPQTAKMTEPAYQEFSPEKMALEQRIDGTEIRVIAGETNAGTIGSVTNEYTHPTYMDISLPEGVAFNQAILAGHNAFIYVIEGELSVGELSVGQKVQALGAKTLGVFGPGDQISVTAKSITTRFLLAAGQKLDEPVVRGGPFVMNTKEELNQAFDDFRYGRF